MLKFTSKHVLTAFFSLAVGASAMSYVGFQNYNTVYQEKVKVEEKLVDAKKESKENHEQVKTITKRFEDVATELDSSKEELTKVQQELQSANEALTQQKQANAELNEKNKQVIAEKEKLRNELDSKK